jgi:hypothetical protein
MCIMFTCSVRWRPSGGRGEYEITPSAPFLDKRFIVSVPALGVEVESEVYARLRHGKPRLRKLDSNDRHKLHLVQLVMAMARLPSPAREEHHGACIWPLEAGGFVVSSMEFEVIETLQDRIVVVPISASVLHSDQQIDLAAHFQAIVEDAATVNKMARQHPELALAIGEHLACLRLNENSSAIQRAAEEVIRKQRDIFGTSNGAAISSIMKLPISPYEDDYVGLEGRVLVRIHSFKERDRRLSTEAKRIFKLKNGGRLFCECCGFEPLTLYGERGRERLDAHHRRPVEEMQIETETRIDDLAILCPNCHDVIHARRPWITVEALREEIENLRSVAKGELNQLI